MKNPVARSEMRARVRTIALSGFASFDDQVGGLAECAEIAISDEEPTQKADRKKDD